ncbi:helix-turn-helix domain-containing protein [Planctomycetota bacterium]
MPDRWVSVTEIAEHLGIKKDTVYKWVRTRGMPSHKVGRLLKFQIHEVDTWVREGKAASADRKQE